MKRRSVLVGSAVALSTSSLAKLGYAQSSSAPDPERLKQELTPFGGERAGNAAGTIPPWTGGATEIPAGWSKGMKPPDLFAGEQPLYTITAANADQYAEILSIGQMAMLKKYGAAGYKMVVYPTHRTACAPQYVYDNTYKNVTRTKPVPEGVINGFTGAVGGTPFPILSDDPATAGAQAIWNHNARWNGFCYHTVSTNGVGSPSGYTMTGQLDYSARYNYYAPDVTPETFKGYYVNFFLLSLAPANINGGKFETSFSYQPLKYPNTTYEYLTGEGRIREAPQAQYDIPNTQAADAYNYDEVNVFDGALDRYTWKLVGKKEALISYNNHAMLMATEAELFGKQFLNPDLVRYELHRCWVVEATLAPGKRMTEPFRRFYIDEDTWVISHGESYDEQNNLWKHDLNYFTTHPGLPGNQALHNIVYNLQAGEYAGNVCFYWPTSDGIGFDEISASLFNPQSMVNSGGL